MPAGKTAPNHQFAGTPTFCSVAVDKGEQPGAYDDLEALVCLLLTSSIKNGITFIQRLLAFFPRF